MTKTTVAILVLINIFIIKHFFITYSKRDIISSRVSEHFLRKIERGKNNLEILQNIGNKLQTENIKRNGRNKVKVHEEPQSKSIIVIITDKDTDKILLYFRPKFRFLTKISIFVQNFDV